MTWTRAAATVGMTIIPIINSIGCATIEYQKASSTERLLSTRQVPESVGFVPEVSQEGTLLRARLTTDCRIRPYETVETTTRFEAVNTTPGKDWAFGISGAALAGLGVWGILDASKTYTDDVHSRTYNPVGPGAAKGVGIGALVAGGALLTVAAVDVVLAMQGRSKISTEELAREAGPPCQGAPIANATVTLAASGQQIVAPTDPNGTATFDLQEVRSLSGPVTIGVPNGKGSETKEVAVNWAPVVAQRKASEAEAAKTAKLSADTKLVEQIEAAVASVDRTLTSLEATKDPWGDDELERAKGMATVFNDVQQNVKVLLGRTPIDPALVHRLVPLTPLIGKLGSRARALMPNVRKAAEARNMRNAAFLTALINAGAFSSNSSSASSSAPSSDDSRLREMEDRHQRERAEDERRRQRERDDDANQREREARSRAAEQDEQRKRARESCRSRCQETYSRCSRDCNSSNWDACTRTCASRNNECYQDCDSR